MGPFRRLAFSVAALVAGIFALAACSSSAAEPVPADSPTSGGATAPDSQASTAAAVAAPGGPNTTVASEPTAVGTENSLLLTPDELEKVQARVRTGDEKYAPEIRGIANWINSEPLTIADQHGKVVLIDFWTYTCVNCIRTLPFIKAWHEKYEDKGLVILGIHTPEFEFEKDTDNVVQAMKDFGLTYPVAQDNDFGTWRAFNNRFWPAKYLIDAEGYIRYTHFGEGAYGETEEWIRDLLIQAGADLTDIPANTEPEPRPDAAALRAEPGLGPTRELYAGYERNIGALLSRNSPPYVLHREFYDDQDVNILYADPGDYQNNFLYIQGLWNNSAEHLTHARATTDYEDYLAIKFFATSVNTVMLPTDVSELEVRVTMDEAPVSREDAGVDIEFDSVGNSYINVNEARMYNVVNLMEFGGHELKLSSNSPGLSVFAYTFGVYEGGEPNTEGLGVDNYEG